MCLPKFKKNIEINMSPWHNRLYGIVGGENPALLKSNPEKGRNFHHFPPEEGNARQNPSQFNGVSWFP